MTFAAGGPYNTLATLVMVAWIPLVLVLFAWLKPRRAVLASFALAWMFLPQASFEVKGIPDFDKVTATCLGSFLGILMFDSSRLFAFRPRLIDLPIVLWCGAPFFASVTNGLGVYDGLSNSLRIVFLWGMPYVIGRLYLTNLTAVRELAITIFLGGLIYAPLCLFESRFSPQLHNWLYGAHQHSFAQTMRFGGFRPMVFMAHGLMVGVWMAAATLSAYWLWRTGSLKRIASFPIWMYVGGLALTTVMCKSLGALALLFMGAATLELTKRLRTPVAVLLLAAVPLLYPVARATGVWNGEPVPSLVRTFVNDARASSLETRFRNESRLADHALRKPVFGWGGYGRNRVIDADGKDRTISDGLWIITLGMYGTYGLVTLTAVLVLPPILLALRTGREDWSHPLAAGAVFMCVMLLIYGVDNLLNAMINPVFTLGAGGLATLVSAMSRGPEIAQFRAMRGTNISIAGGRS